MHDDFGLRYVNCGDWVESCTAVGERLDGRFEILSWTETDSRRQIPESIEQVQAA